MKINKLKLIKGISFVVVAILFLFSKFYNITRYHTFEGNELDLWRLSFTIGDRSYFDLIWQKTIINFIFSGLFFIIGVIEIKEAVRNG